MKKDICAKQYIVGMHIYAIFWSVARRELEEVWQEENILKMPKDKDN